MLRDVDDKPDKRSYKKLVNKRISNNIEMQLEKLNVYDKTIYELMLKKVFEFQNENKMLTEKNQRSHINLKSLKTCLSNVQSDVENWKNNYKILQLKNKNLLAKLLSTTKVLETNDSDLSENLRSKSKLTEKSAQNKIIFSKSCLVILKFYLFYN